MKRLLGTLGLLTCCFSGVARTTGEETRGSGTPEQIAFFEKKIRPVLAEKCYKCHSAAAEKIKGGLLLDTPRGRRARAATWARPSCPATRTRACSSRRSATTTRTSRCRQEGRSCRTR